MPQQSPHFRLMTKATSNFSDLPVLEGKGKAEPTASALIGTTGAKQGPAWNSIMHKKLETELELDHAVTLPRS